MKLYENVVIGNFLYGLGFALGSQLRSGQLPSMVNLLQQTPDDKRLGDLLMAFPGTVRLIEFKTEANKSKKEAGRHQFLSRIFSEKLDELPDLPGTSRRVHWYIETAPLPSAALSARIEPYLDAFGEGARHGLSQARGSKILSRSWLLAFCNADRLRSQRLSATTSIWCGLLKGQRRPEQADWCLWPAAVEVCISPPYRI